MEVGLSSLPDTINPSNFPAKLWRLVNDPTSKAICWDRYGVLVVIDQQLFEREVLCPITADSAETFKTTNFSSFVRQLNLYGFKKADTQHDLDTKAYHCFYNPDFKRDHPELVARLKRLTVDNKTKLQAGLTVKSRPPGRCQRFWWNEGGRDVRRGSPGGSLLLSPSIHEAIHPYYSQKSQAMKSYSGTPVPPQYQIRSHAYTRVTSSSNAVHFHQSLLAQTNCGSPDFTTFSPCNVQQYQPDCYSPVCSFYCPNRVAPYMAGGGFQAGLFCPQSYYQAGCPANMSFLRGNNRGLQKNENQEAENYEDNLEGIFQVANEIMQTPPNTCLVKVEPQEEELVPGLEWSANACYAILCGSSSGTMGSNPFCAGEAIASSNDPVVTYKEEQECVVSVPEQVSEDAIVEVTDDYARDTDIPAGDGIKNASQELQEQLHKKYTSSSDLSLLF